MKLRNYMIACGMLLGATGYVSISPAVAQQEVASETKVSRIVAETSPLMAETEEIKLTPRSDIPAITLDTQIMLIVEPKPEDIAAKKCEFLWQRIKPAYYKPELANFFVQEHYKRGLVDLWPYSIAYGWVNTDLDPNMVYQGAAYGEMDVQWNTIKNRRKEYEDLLKPEYGYAKWDSNVLTKNRRVNYRAHCIEASEYWNRAGHIPLNTLKWVFYPHDPSLANGLAESWQGKVDAMNALLKAGYEKGLI